jgi:hypothetical protein
LTIFPQQTGAIRLETPRAIPPAQRAESLLGICCLLKSQFQRGAASPRHAETGILLGFYFMASPLGFQLFPHLLPYNAAKRPLRGHFAAYLLLRRFCLKRWLHQRFRQNRRNLVNSPVKLAY